jgi:small-conductance mechanosensitive channel
MNISDFLLQKQYSHIQLFFIASSFLFGHLLYFFFKTRFFLRILAKQHINYSIRKYYLPLLWLVCNFVLFGLAISIHQQLYNSSFFLVSILKVLSAIIIIRFIRLAIASSFLSGLVIILLVPTFFLQVFNMLDSVIEYLDQFDFKLGKVRISIYLILKVVIVLLTVFSMAGFIIARLKNYINNNKSIKINTRNIINKFVDIVIYSIVFIIILKTFGVDLTAFAVIGGAVGVGIGFGLQKIASNFISGVILLFEKSVEVGDIVELENGNIYGTIRHFSGRYTLVEAMDGKEIMIPNEEFIVNKVTNWTYSNSKARIEIVIGVAYGSDLVKAKQIIINCAKQHRRCLKNPEVECFLTTFDDYDIKFVLYFWIADIVDGRMGAKSDVMVAIYQQLTANGIVIPIPQRELKIING